jgi:hypothetical protein
MIGTLVAQLTFQFLGQLQRTIDNFGLLYHHYTYGIIRSSGSKETGVGEMAVKHFETLFWVTNGQNE